jgi:hypothetical protein
MRKSLAHGHAEPLWQAAGLYRAAFADTMRTPQPSNIVNFSP